MPKSAAFRCAFTLLCVWCFTNNAAAYTLKTTSTGNTVRWPNSAMRIELRLGEGVEALLPPGQVYAAAAMAVEAWRFIGVPDVRVAEGQAAPYNPNARNNGIYVLRDWPFEDNRLAVTVTSYMPSGELIGADVLINGNVDYGLLPEGVDSVGLAGQHDLAAVMTHEIGHVLGLDESDAHESATMWPYIRAGETHQRSLDEDDEAGVIELYTRVPAPLTDAGCVSNTVAGRTSGPSRSMGSATVAGACLLLLCRRRQSARSRRIIR